MFYTIYKTTNLIDGKYYIGKHKTQDLDDNYLGSGKILHYAIKKHGINNFIKEYLFIFDNEEDMNNKEAELVNESFIKEDTNYNLKLGGDGGWDYLNVPSNISQKVSAGLACQEMYRNNPKLDIERRKHLKELMIGNTISKEWRKTNPDHRTFLGKSHSEETKELMRKSKNVGKDNPQYGTMWIHSLEEKISKRIKKDEIIPEGWYKGRKMKF